MPGYKYLLNNNYLENTHLKKIDIKNNFNYLTNYSFEQIYMTKSIYSDVKKKVNLTKIKTKSWNLPASCYFSFDYKTHLAFYPLKTNVQTPIYNYIENMNFNKFYQGQVLFSRVNGRTYIGKEYFLGYNIKGFIIL